MTTRFGTRVPHNTYPTRNTLGSITLNHPVPTRVCSVGYILRRHPGINSSIYPGIIRVTTISFGQNSIHLLDTPLEGFLTLNHRMPTRVCLAGHSLRRYPGIYPGMIVPSRFGTRVPLSVYATRHTLGTIPYSEYSHARKSVFSRVHAPEIPGYIPGYDHNNQVWYSGILEYIPYQTPPWRHSIL